MRDVPAEPSASSATLRYHQLGRIGRGRARRRILGVVALPVFWFVLALPAIGIAYGIHEPDVDGRPPPSPFDQIWELGVLMLVLAIAVPAARLTARWVDARPAGWLSSVAGRIRWRWLGLCAGVAAAPYALLAPVGLALDPPSSVDVGFTLTVLAVALVLVPLQSAAEEYVFRGYLPQAIGIRFDNYWIPAVLLSVAFGLVHGPLALQGGIWALIDRSLFGLIAAWLTIRTGGLEAAIALHAVGNVFGIAALGLYDELDDFVVLEAEPYVQAWEAAVDIALLTGIALVLLRLARGRVSATRVDDA